MTTQPEHPCRTQWQRDRLKLDVTCPNIQMLADVAQRWAVSLCEQSHPRTLVLAGLPGCGKTHVARCLYAFARGVSFEVFTKMKLRRPLECFFRSWPEVVDGFKDFQFEAMETLFTTDVLFLDDIGAEGDTLARVATEKLCQVLSRRENRFTVITTNIRPEHWVEKFGERSYDRLFRGSKIVDLFNTPSYSFK